MSAGAKRRRHPLHPLFVHFPLALLGTSLLFDAIGLARGEALWWAIAFWNIALGLATGLVAACTGLVDSLRIPPESRAARLVNYHLGAVLGSLACYGAALALRASPEAPGGTTLVGTLVLEGLGLGLLLLGGWLGAEMVYRHGVGRIDPAA